MGCVVAFRQSSTIRAKGGGASSASGSAKLIAVLPEGYYQLETAVKGRTHTMFLPVSQTALVFTEPEPEPEAGIEIER